MDPAHSSSTVRSDEIIASEGHLRASFSHRHYTSNGHDTEELFPELCKMFHLLHIVQQWSNRWEKKLIEMDQKEKAM